MRVLRRGWRSNSRSTRKDFFLRSIKSEVGTVKLDDLAQLLGKSRAEVERMLQQDDVIELKLTETRRKDMDDEGSIILFK